jgi:hypothetical protein
MINKNIISRSFKMQLRDDPARFFAAISFIPGLIVFLCFLLRVLAELRSGQWEMDLDYLMYMADQWLSGRPPWIYEFDDKLPISNIFFLPAALAGSIRIYQLQTALIIMTGGAAAAYVFINQAKSIRDLPKFMIYAVGLFSGAIFCYSLAFTASSINTINSVSASLFMIATALLFFSANRDRSRSRMLSLPSLISALVFAVAVSIRPYYILASILIMAWVYLTAKTKFLLSLFQACLIWTLLIFGSGLILNVLPYLASGNLQALIAGLSILSQKLIPSTLQEMVKRQFFDIISLPDLLFLASTSSVFLLLVLFLAPKFLPQFLRFQDFKPADLSKLRVNALFVGLFLTASVELVILRKHYYPHYLQLFVPFTSLSIAFLLAAIAPALKNINIVARPKLAIYSILLLLAVLRTDFAYAVNDSLHPILDSRTAEYATFSRDPAMAARLKKGFLYPESMSLHWKMHSRRFGMPNSYSFKLISDGDWQAINMPAYFKLPTTPDSLCQSLLESGAPTIITKTDSIASCLDNDPKRTYRQLTSIDHSLIDLATKAQKSSPYTIRVYERVNGADRKSQ